MVTRCVGVEISSRCRVGLPHVGAPAARKIWDVTFGPSIAQMGLLAFIQILLTTIYLSKTYFIFQHPDDQADLVNVNWNFGQVHVHASRHALRPISLG
jgi:hypothetical protein